MRMGFIAVIMTTVGGSVIEEVWNLFTANSILNYETIDGGSIYDL